MQVFGRACGKWFLWQVADFLQQIEALALLVESSELQHKAVIETTAAEHAPFAVAPTQSTLKLSFFDVAPMLDVPPNGSM